ncbi:hypothetical protein B566_EDAN007938 [Ephemera danica]|nr:hypothetical protein B566_EDAN007938 [Ephemera danica]
MDIFGHISGAHLNPALSLSAVILKKITFVEFIVYTAAQLLGAVAGYGLLKQEIGLKDTVGDHGFCMTLPSKEITTFQAFIVEFFATSFLNLVLCSAWDVRNADKHDSMPIKFGFVIITLAFCAPDHSDQPSGMETSLPTG